MSKLFIEEQTLTSIGNAIRSKTGKTDLINPAAMAGEIEGISGGDLPQELLTFSGDCSYLFMQNNWNEFIKRFGNRISCNDITNANYMFGYNTELTEIPFDIHVQNISLKNMFYICYSLKSLPNIYGSITEMAFAFYKLQSLTSITDEWVANIDLSELNKSLTNFTSNVFQNCYSLKHIPEQLIGAIYNSTLSSGPSYYPYYNQYNNCYCLDEVVNIPVRYPTDASHEISKNIMSYMFTNCHRLKRVVFNYQPIGGQEIEDKWDNQTIDLSSYVGYASSADNIIGYNSGLTTATQITDQASYEALKDNPDNWTTMIEYSRYNHDSAVETINSLPDCSAYLATTTGTNTIKFKSSSGKLTDGGAISELTPEEIAVATAKGWTVSLV